MKRQLSSTLAVAALVATTLAGAWEEERSVQSGVFTVEQAERGAKTFETICKGCHETEEFNDGSYLDGWSGQKVDDFVELVRSTMPQDSPGSLKRMDYVDVAAYFLQLNGVPPGDSEMDSSTIKEIVFEGPFGSSPDPANDSSPER
jgi:hypothetical protein